VVFPWLAFGHIIPYLELSQQLAKRGHFVTFLSAPRGTSPGCDGFPDGAECTADIPPEKTELLKVAFDGLAAPFTAFLAEACSAGGEEGHGKKPNWIVVDFAHNWLPPIADEHKARSSPSHSIQ
jgi:hypothetical protein